MWAGPDQQRSRLGGQGWNGAPRRKPPRRPPAAACDWREWTAAPPLTDQDYFNALRLGVLLAEASRGAYTGLRRHSAVMELVAPDTAGEILFGDGMTRLAVTGRHQDGRGSSHTALTARAAAGQDLLLRVRTDGLARRRDEYRHAGAAHAGDTIASLGSVVAAQPADASHSGLRRGLSHNDLHDVTSCSYRTKDLVQVAGQRPCLELLALPGAAREPNGDAAQAPRGDPGSQTPCSRTCRSSSTIAAARLLSRSSMLLRRRHASTFSGAVCTAVWDVVGYRLDAVHSRPQLRYLLTAALIGAVGILTTRTILSSAPWLWGWNTTRSWASPSASTSEPGGRYSAAVHPARRTLGSYYW